MNQGRPLPLSHDELTDEDMNMLPVSARFLAIVLRARAAENATGRLNLPLVKGQVFPLDATVTADSLETDVLELESAGVLRTWVGADGLQRYRMLRFATTSAEAAPSPLQAAGPRFIASVGREKREGESERESARETPTTSRRTPLRPPPPRYCDDHLPAGSGGQPCVKCQDRRMDFIAWNYERTHPAPGTEHDDDR